MQGSAFDGERHFSGIITRTVLVHVSEAYGQAVVDRVLARAGEAGAEDELRDNASWLPYGRLRRLLESVAEEFGGFEVLREAGAGGRRDEASRPEMTQMLLDFGSPDNLLRTAMGYGTGFGVSTVLTYEGEQRGPGDWILRQRFDDGFESFPEFCAFWRGLHCVIPSLFGMAPADVVEERCASRGAPACEFRVRWDESPDPAQERRFFETRSQLLEIRLQNLQRTVVDLVSAPDPAAGLERVLQATVRAVHVPAYLLVVDPAVPLTPRLHFSGLAEKEAAALAETLAERAVGETPGMVVVEVSSTRCTYGYLALIEPGGRRFLPQERALAESYAGLAAAALDSATALEEARRQATTAGTLLDLSSSLTELATTEEMAFNLARAVPSVIDCDRSIVLVHEPSTGAARIAATHGFPEILERRLGEAQLPASVLSSLAGGVSFYAEGEITGFRLTYGLELDAAPVSAASTPMVSNGELIGALVVLVTERPERLRENPSLGEALRGLAGQAAVAIRNARLADEVRHQALHDGLTGLPNRTLVLDRLSQALSRAKRGGRPVAALFLDLDGFKAVNDTLGHGAGDRLLVALADRLRRALRDSDTLGRLGGDEFVVVAEGASLEAGPEVIAERILELMRVPFELDGFEEAAVRVTTSIGIALGRSESAGELLRDADVALYHAKEAGKDRYALYEPEMSDRVHARLELEKDVRLAVEQAQFFLAYQPFFDLSDGRVLGAEALLRWRHPRRGVLDAGDFVPLLDEVGALCDVGRWVLHEAARQGRRWHGMGHHIDVSVNVSRTQLESGRLAEDVDGALSASGFQPSSLVLEVNESTLVHDSAAVVAELERLKWRGVKIAVDDFGTAYSSLAYLSQFPVDGVKIDRSFIASIEDSSEAGTLIRVLLDLGRALGLATVAEGIESSAQISRLKKERCEGGQGFLLARPLSPEALEELLVLRS